MIWLVVLLLACPAKRADKRADAMSNVAEAIASTSSVPVGPGPWEGRGLSMMIPPDWSGEAGLPEDPLALIVRHPSGLVMEIWTWPAPDELVPQLRDGCEPLWADAGAWRLLPGLPVSLATACVVDATGEVVEGYQAIVGDREVHVVVAYPAGRVIEGRERTAGLLATLRRSQSVVLEPEGF